MTWPWCLLYGLFEVENIERLLQTKCLLVSYNSFWKEWSQFPLRQVPHAAYILKIGSKYLAHKASQPHPWDKIVKGYSNERMCFQRKTTIRCLQKVALANTTDLSRQCVRIIYMFNNGVTNCHLYRTINQRKPVTICYDNVQGGLLAFGLVGRIVRDIKKDDLLRSGKHSGKKASWTTAQVQDESV